LGAPNDDCDAISLADGEPFGERGASQALNRSLGEQHAPGSKIGRVLAVLVR
jgi:hypothetical protein